MVILFWVFFVFFWSCEFCVKLGVLCAFERFLG